MKKYLIIFLSFLLTLYSCSGPAPASSTPTPVSVQLPNAFFGLLDKFHQGNLKNTKITISVDKYNGNGQLEANYKTYTKVDRKNDFLNNNNNCIFTGIEVPSSGTYAVTVTVDTNECYNFIYGASCNYTQGMALYRGVSTTYNATSSPGTIWVTPTQASVY